MLQKIRTLLFSTLYPSSVRPNQGIFVETRLRHLLACGEVEARVVAPVPWFPFRHKMFGDYATHATVPLQETRNGIQVAHPRYMLLPKIGMNGAPHALAHTGLTAAKRLISEGYDFDLIDAHYFFPDGVAATIMGKILDKPVVITARGSDINVIPQYKKPRRMILDAMCNCAAVISVSAALRDAMVKLGGPADKITVLRNGVDLKLFYPEDTELARGRFGIAGDRYVLASVGNLIPSKGHQLVIDALRDMPDAELLIAGQGPYDDRFRKLAAQLGVADRVRLVGLMTQHELRILYSAADVLVLASEREGWPNVLLEAMACGTPVVASCVGGVPEIVAGRHAGRLMADRSARAIVQSISDLRATPPAREATRAYAQQFDWNATTHGQLGLFARTLGRTRA